MAGLFTELKRRNVFKVSIVYAVVAWLVAQIVSVIQDPLHLPDWFDTAIIVLLIIGFPIAVILAWAFDLTPQGIRRTGATIEGGETAGSAPGAVPVLSDPVIDEQSIAVLPFVDMSPDRDQEYFSDGISEELLNQLAKVRGLHVAGRTSSFHFKGHTGDIAEVARKLRVAHVLEGSVRKAGNRVRVTAQLIKADNGYHLWSETYDRDLDDIFAIQESIAHAVTGALSIALGVGDLKVGTRSVAAYEAYLAGSALYAAGTGDGWLKAVDLLREATAVDPQFKDAWVLLARATNLAPVIFMEHAEEMKRLEREAVERAAAIAPGAPDVLCIQAQLMEGADGLVESARKYEQAARMAPNDSLALQSWAIFLSGVGRLRDSVAAMRRWERVEPMSVQAGYVVGLALEAAGELDQAMAQYRRIAQLHGDVSAAAGPALSIHMTRGDRDAIRAGIDNVLKSAMGVPQHDDLTRAMRDHLDDPPAALAVLREYVASLDTMPPLLRSVLALWASYFSDHELAMEAYSSLEGNVSTMLWVTMWRPLHRDMRRLPGFKLLLRRLGQERYWRESGHWGDYVRPVGDDDFEVTG